MRKILIVGVFASLAISQVNAEIVKNAAGEKIELKSNGTWTKIPLTADDILTDGKQYTISLDDGNKQKTEVNVYPDITLMGVAKPLTKDDIGFRIKTTSLTAQYKLKNIYSYKPKEVFVTQKGKDVSIRIKYTGDNSYGAAVVGNYESTFYIEDTGKLKQTSSML